MRRDTPAARADWKTLDLPESISAFDLDFDLGPDELERVSMGFVPEVMEDKWFIYRDGDRLLFHRSWTGSCVYSASIEEHEHGGRIGRVLVNRDAGQYRETDDRYDAQLLRFLIEAILLERNIPFPIPAEAAALQHRGVYQHVVTGTGFPEIVVERRDAKPVREPWWRRMLHRIRSRES